MRIAQVISCTFELLGLKIKFKQSNFRNRSISRTFDSERHDAIQSTWAQSHKQIKYDDNHAVSWCEDGVSYSSW